MTEAEWLACKELNPLLLALHSQGDERRCRLLTCAFGRERGKAIQDERFWRIVAAGELWADEGEEPETIGIREDGIQFMEELEPHDPRRYDTAIATLDALCCLHLDPLSVFVQYVPTGWLRLREIGRDVADWMRLGVSYRKRRPYPRHWCGFVRDIFGNPFRPVTFVPEWSTDTAVAIARGMYEARDFGAMPILADALQDAGCDHPDVLHHCRDTSLTHVRGCWVVDLVLGKV